MFLRSVNIHTPAPWCAAFANYVLQQSRVPHTMTGLATSCCPATPFLIFSKGKKRLAQAPQPGDLFFWFRPGGGHTGFIAEWPASGDYFTTIEGNVSTPDGRQGVAIKQRKKANVQKIYAASMLPFAAADDDETGTTPATPRDSNTQTQAVNPKVDNTPNTPPTPPTEAPTPPYTIILLLIILAILWRQGKFKTQ